MNLSRWGKLCPAALLLVLASSGLAFMQPKQEPLPNFDKRNGAASPTAEQSAASARLHKRLPAARVEFNRVTGVPEFISARDGFLTGTNGTGRAVAAGHVFGRSEIGRASCRERV